jgi:Alpha/beta hydrolase of unknown function (DUF900)
MAHFFMVPTNENGITDPEVIQLDLPMALSQPFDFSEVFLYSHGWSTTASSAMLMYNKFGIGFVKTILEGLAKSTTLPECLATGIHWPSMISEDPTSPINDLEVLSFYTMEKRADIVGAHTGYSIFRTLMEQGKGIKRINLIGHSFGCKVVLSTLQEIAQEIAKEGGPINIPVNVILLEPATDDNNLEPGDAYGDVISCFPNLRMFITISGADKALQTWYPLAGKINIFNRDTRQALGAAGPDITVVSLFQGDNGSLSIDNDFNAGDPANLSALNHKLVVVDLTLIHQYRIQNGLYKSDPWSGSHSDIFFDQLYSAIAKFLYETP